MEGAACGAVAEIWRYPVKSMLGERLAASTLGERGVSGDRGWAIQDRETGKIASAKRPRIWGALLTCQVAMDGERDVATITLPGGRRVIAGENGADAALSAFLGRSVSLIAKPPAVAEIERYWPDIAGLDQRDTVTANDIAASAPGTFFDFAPIHLVTTASLANLRALHPRGQIPVTRFRPNLIIETGGAPGWVENSWVERTLRMGHEVRLRVITPTPRCIVPTLEQPDAPRDTNVLRAIATHNRPPIPPLGGRPQASLGVYALVERPGVIQRGDRIWLADDA